MCLPGWPLGSVFRGLGSAEDGSRDVTEECSLGCLSACCVPGALWGSSVDLGEGLLRDPEP